LRISNCRSCNGTDLNVVLDLGCHPISNGLLASYGEAAVEKRYPLEVALCADCALLQVTETIPPTVLYQQNYPYFSSASPALLAHATTAVDRLVHDLRLDTSSFVVEIACNDGYLLRNFVARKIPCLGIDPAVGPANHARAAGIPVINDFFSFRLADALAARGQLADLVIGNNVIAHVDAINDFVRGVERLLKPDGVAVFECAYAVHLVQKCEFDTIYHEHLFYHTLHGLTPLLLRHGLQIVDAEELPIHGGSLRIRAARSGSRTERLNGMLAHERTLGVDRPQWCEGLATRTRALRDSVKELLLAEKAKGRRIACYGAAAKGATLLNFLDLGAGFFEYAVDANPHKQGKLMPGQHIPIVPPRRLQEDPPDVVLLLVWNFAGEVLRQQHAYRAAGGRFLIPVPEPRWVEPETFVGEDRYALPQAGAFVDVSLPSRLPAVSAD
jgi:SAM-dependent methyltransferase